jgi:glycosyltransferase involved in cell wall biosynthesis
VSRPHRVSIALGRLRLMRILFATDEFPGPLRSGYQIRMGKILETLVSLGDVDLVVAVGGKRSSGTIPPDLGVVRSTVVTLRRMRGGRLLVSLRWATSRVPRVLLRSDWSEARRDLRSWLRQPYDLAWFSHRTVYLKLGDLVGAPAIVDLDDLNSALLRHRRLADTWMAPSRHYSRSGGVARRLVKFTDRIDERRWERVDSRIAASAAAVVVCSEIDQHRLSASNGVVIPNGYELQGMPDVPGGDPTADPVLVMIGRLVYEPNLDGAFYFVDRVWPLVLQEVPAAQLRLVGAFRSESDVAWLRAQPGVNVVGEVEHVGPELWSSSLAVVPLRYGGGTRIKILEAFAYRLPVVSTTVGCEGLDLDGGRHLLIADRPEDFASACVRLLRDRELRRALTEAAYELYCARYAWHLIRPSVESLAADVASTRGSPALTRAGSR